jgi:cell wall-associated NlpC family hydrolase
VALPGHRLVAAASVLAVPVLVVSLATPAEADPSYPSAKDVARSKAAVASAATLVGQSEARLAAADAQLERLGVLVGEAVEAYNGARLRQDRALHAAAAAADRAADADQDVADTQRAMGRMAADTYRSGGLPGWNALLGATGPQDLVDRAATLDVISARQQATYDRLRVTRAVARALRRQAAAAYAEKQRAAEAVAAAKRTAEERLAAQKDAVASLSAERTRLVAILAVARRTSVALEQARQLGLQREREARERAARAAAARRAEEQRRRDQQRRLEQQRREAEQRRQDQQNQQSQQSQQSSGGGSDPGQSSSFAPAPAGPPPSGHSSGTSSGAAAAIDYARAQLGKHYVWAAVGPETFDCSGLTMRAWEAGGVSLPHYSVAQYEQGEKVSLGELRRGDLVFFASDPNDYSTIYHVGLYIGGGQMIEAPYTGADVRISSIYRDSLFGAARP